MFRSPQVWTPAQRGVLIAFVLMLCLALSARFYFNRAYVSNPPQTQPAQLDDLADKIDPNVAGWEELAVLPTLGEKRARAIIAYREEFVAKHPGQRAFSRAEDLMRVSGIGRAMTGALRPFLMFPATQPAGL